HLTLDAAEPAERLGLGRLVEHPIPPGGSVRPGAARVNRGVPPPPSEVEEGGLLRGRDGLAARGGGGLPPFLRPSGVGGGRPGKLPALLLGDALAGRPRVRPPRPPPPPSPSRRGRSRRPASRRP